eukprot:COSAG03_NODE_9161_length_742_cov_0.654743_1_plen_161_part_00
MSTLPGDGNANDIYVVTEAGKRSEMFLAQCLGGGQCAGTYVRKTRTTANDEGYSEEFRLPNYPDAPARGDYTVCTPQQNCYEPDRFWSIRADSDCSSSLTDAFAEYANQNTCLGQFGARAVAVGDFNCPPIHTFSVKYVDIACFALVFSVLDCSYRLVHM